MKKQTTTLLLVISFLGAGVVWGKFAQPDLEQVPVTRLQANLENQLRDAPSNFQAHYALARVHAMAYALKDGELPVDKRTGKVFYRHEPANDYPPPKVNQVGAADLDDKARRHLVQAIEHYRKAVAIQKDHWPSQLGLAWALQQQGTNAVPEFRKALALAWQQDKDKDHFFYSSATEEIAGYLVPLLDRQRDAAELATIEGNLAVVRKKPRAITPLLIPLTAQTNLHELVDPQANVAFDLDGSNLGHRWGWPKAVAGWLVFDRGNHGTIRSGLQLFGNVSFWIFWENGYQALAALDDNADGELRGDELRDLAIWQDINSNGVSEPGEVRPVSSWHITALSCSRQTHASGISYNPRGVIFEDGAVRPTYDWIAVSEPSVLFRNNSAIGGR